MVQPLFLSIFRSHKTAVRTAILRAPLPSCMSARFATWCQSWLTNAKSRSEPSRGPNGLSGFRSDGKAATSILQLICAGSEWFLRKIEPKGKAFVPRFDR